MSLLATLARDEGALRVPAYRTDCPTLEGDTSYRTMKPSERPPTLGEVLDPIQMFMQLLNVDAMSLADQHEELTLAHACRLFDDYETGEEFYQSVMDGLHEDADKLIRSFNSVGPFKFVDTVVTGDHELDAVISLHRNDPQSLAHGLLNLISARLHKVPTPDTMSEFYSIIRSHP